MLTPAAAIAANRFGLGARPQDGAAIGNDPRGWLAVVRANPGNAAQGLGVSSGDLIWIRDGS